MRRDRRRVRDAGRTRRSLKTRFASTARQSLTDYKVPRIVVFRDDLPKSNVGKVLRKDLRDEAQQAYLASRKRASLG